MTLSVRLIFDRRANATPQQIANFEGLVWPETVRDFRRCGIELSVTRITAEIRRSASGWPIFEGLAKGAVNVVLTGPLPLRWDRARGLAGAAVTVDGHDVCLIALPWAHGHQVPFLSVNTCVHEMLHIILRDVEERRPEGWQGSMREARIDMYATRLWLFGDGAAIRQALSRR